MYDQLSHQCGDSADDLYMIYSANKEFARIAGNKACDDTTMIPKRYHSDALLEDLFMHVREMNHPGSDMKFCTFYLLGTCGSGKSTALFKILEEYERVRPEAKMLLHTSRCALAEQLMLNAGKSSLDFKHYSDLEDPSSSRKLVMQVESTHKLMDEKRAAGVQFDVLVVDELFAHMKQLIAETMDKQLQIDTLRYFNHLLQSAKLVICMCADTQEGDVIFEYIRKIRRMNPCKDGQQTHKEDFEHGEQVFKVTSPASGLSIFVEDPESVQAAVCHSLDQGENVWFFSNSRTVVRELANRVQSRARERGDVAAFNGVLIVSGIKEDITEAAKKEVMTKEVFKLGHRPALYMTADGEIKPNTTGKRFPIRLFLYTPSITHGFSWEDEACYFTRFMGIVIASQVPVRDFLQQACRNRNCRNLLVGARQSKVKGPDTTDVRTDAEEICDNQTALLKAGDLYNYTDEPRAKKRRKCNSQDLVCFHSSVSQPQPNTAEACHEELRRFFAAEELASQQDVIGELLRLCANHGTHKVYLSTNADGFHHAHSQFMDQYHRCSHIHHVSVRAAGQKPTSSPIKELTPFSIDWYLANATGTAREKLFGKPKTIAAALLLGPLVQNIRRSMEWWESDSWTRVFKTIMLLYGLGKPDSPVCARDLDLLQDVNNPTGLLDLNFIKHSGSSGFEQVFRQVHERSPKQLRKMKNVILRRWNETTPEEQAKKWNSLANVWIKRHLGLLIDTNATRQRSSKQKLQIAWPFDRRLLKMVYEWASNYSSEVPEAEVPDLCKSMMDSLLVEMGALEGKLENNNRETTRGSGQANSTAAVARFTMCSIPEDHTKLTAPEYFEEKKRARLAQCNTFRLPDTKIIKA